MTHPSTNYIEPLMKILREQDSNAPHYWALDVIEYMPESMVEEALPELKKLVIPFNPSWLKEVIEKYFETIVFNDEGAEDFISTLVDSSNEMVKYRAKYWMETFEVERREDAEED
ncbi:hypothetical protein WG8_3567 [Paenibacillus sp. Aloe-11]|nr:hypothetical protein WG8_3567 [Paenibacillus sp. Aloe-11]